MLFNIILRFLTIDDPVKAEDCEALLRRAEDGEEEVFLPELVIADIVWTLEKDYRVVRSRIREMMSRILDLSSLRCKK